MLGIHPKHSLLFRLQSDNLKSFPKSRGFRSTIKPERGVFLRVPLTKKRRITQEFSNHFDFQHGVEIRRTKDAYSTFAGGEGSVLPCNHMDFVLVTSSIEKVCNDRISLLQDTFRE